MHELGGFSSYEERGSDLRKDHGPWAPWRLVACKYAKGSGKWPMNWGRAAQSVNKTVPEPLFRSTHPDDPLHVHGTGPITKSQPVATLSYAFPSGARASPQEAVFAAASPSIDTPLAKPSLPDPACPAQRDCRQVVKAKSLPPSPAPSPKPAPSEPFAVNLF